MPDVNVLIYAYYPRAAQHEPARRWFEGQFREPELFGFTWQAITGFLRISTSPRVFDKPYSVTEAARIVNSWLDEPKATILLPTDQHWSILRDIALDGQAAGALLMDAHLAALAIEHGATIATTDRDFTRFKGVKTLDPLA